MSRTEIEWKAALVFRIWRAVEYQFKSSADYPGSYQRLVDKQKSEFRHVVATKIPAVDAAWKIEARRRYARNASAYKSVGLHPGRALGRTPGS